MILSHVKALPDICQEPKQHAKQQLDVATPPASCADLLTKCGQPLDFSFEVTSSWLLLTVASLHTAF